MDKRQQLNVRSNDYIDALLKALVNEKCKNKTVATHEAIEYYAMDMLGTEKVMKIKRESLLRKGS